MKKKCFSFILIIFLITFFSACESSQIEYSDETVSTSVQKNNKDKIYLIEWKDQYYFVEGKQEMRKVLRPFSKFPRFLQSFGYVFASFNTDFYVETDAIYRVIDKNVDTGHLGYFHMEIKRDNHTYRDHLGIVHRLPPEEKIDEIFSKLKKPVVKEFKSKNHAEVRELFYRLLEDEKVFCILNADQYKKIEGYYKIYVPASSKEEMTGWRRGEFQRELHELYGQGFESGNSIVIDALPLNFDEETKTAELTCHGPIQVYERIEKYPKSEFKEMSYEWTLKWFEKS